MEPEQTTQSVQADSPIPRPTLRQYLTARTKLRFQIFRRDGFMCRYCGRTPGHRARLTLDHVVPRCLGGSDEPGNLVTACYECNRGKDDQLLNQVEVEFLLAPFRLASMLLRGQ